VNMMRKRRPRRAADRLAFLTASSAIPSFFEIKESA
jgi:hypothetical protein